MWGKIAPREKITNYSSFVMWSNLSLLHMINLQCLVVIYAVLTQCPFCRILRTFVEQKLTHKFCLWSKNDKCHVSTWAIFIDMRYRVFFSHLYPPKKLEYGKPRLGESTWT